MDIRTGKIEDIEYTRHSFGEQVTTIDGQRHLTWFDLLDKNLKGIGQGSVVEYEFMPAPTVLCDEPHIESALSQVRLLRLLPK